MSARNEDLSGYGGWLLESPYEDPYFILNPAPMNPILNQEPEQIVRTLNQEPDQIVREYNPMEPTNNPKTVTNGPEASYANNYALLPYPWGNGMGNKKLHPYPT